VRIRTPRARAAVLLLASALSPALAQLTTDQKVSDFQTIASLYSRSYAPYDWKKTLLNYDAMDLGPWLAQVRASANDLDYLDVVVRYVAALNDTHSRYLTVSDFSATLGFSADAYFDDGRHTYRVLIDTIDRSLLPSSTYPFQVGDELVSVDGVSVRDLVGRFSVYMSAASPESKIRNAVAGIVTRRQSWLAHASDLGDTASVEILRQSGARETYTIRWTKSGAPLTKLGPPRPVTLAAETASFSSSSSVRSDPIDRFRDLSDKNPQAVLGYGSLTPVWARPSNFERRLGTYADDAFYSGVITSQNYRIGYLRIPNFAPAAGTFYGLLQLDPEILYFQDNTDALVVDIMRNNGGYACYVEDVMARLTPNPWRAMTFQARVGWADIDSIESSLADARASGESQATIDLWTGLLQEFRAAYQANRLTNPVSLCDLTPDRAPFPIAYSRPILLLVDEFSTSGADDFAALFQDNQRGKLFGYRTNGAGGSVLGYSAGLYSEGGAAYVTNSMMYRPNSIAAAGYPATHYIENVGVRPDILFDYMRPETLAQSGQPFVDAFLAGIVSQLRAAGVQPIRLAVPPQSRPARNRTGLWNPRLGAPIE